MKTIKYILLGLFAIFTINTFAQNQTNNASIKTTTFKVSGVCELCQAAIEKAAISAGVTKASWNETTKILSISYNPAKVKVEDVQKSIAAAGYDNGKFKATQKSYDSLPACCKYER
ncbi:MAG: heavy-metal-associated domain-containing protein [Bacteroidales bacterium]|jgi:hypothetical protein